MTQMEMDERTQLESLELKNNSVGLGFFGLFLFLIFFMEKLSLKKKGPSSYRCLEKWPESFSGLNKENKNLKI